MKVLLVNKFHYKKGGSETYYFTIGKALEAIGHEVVYFAMKDEKNIPCEQEEFFIDNVDYNGNVGAIDKIKSALSIVYKKESKEKITELIKKEKPDLAILNLVHRQITLSIVEALKEFDIPIFFTMHDLICVCPNYTMLSSDGICEKCLNKKYINCIKQKCIKNSTAKSALGFIEAHYLKFKKVYDDIDMYIAPSDFYRKKLIEGNFTKSNIVHRKNPLPVDTEYRLPDEVSDYILYFGRLSKEKGVLTLFKAVEKLENVVLKVLGAGPEEQELIDYIREHNLSDKIELLGFKTGKELESIVEKSKCVVVPSEWYENGPYSVVEAMAKGRPIIASDLGGLKELVEEGSTGYIFKATDVDELADKIDMLINLSDEEYTKLCKNSLEFAKREFDPISYANWIVENYKLYRKKC